MVALFVQNKSRVKSTAGQYFEDTFLLLEYLLSKCKTELKLVVCFAEWVVTGCGSLL